MDNPNWRDKLPDEVNNRINDLVKRTKQYKDAYEESPHVRTSQLWIALSEAYQEIQFLHNRVAALENALNNQRARARKAAEILGGP